MTTIFEIVPDDIEHLGDADLRTLVGYLAERETLAHGLSASSVTYGGHQNAKDGGIDVRVSIKPGEIDGFIPKPETGFQVKAEDMPRTQILKEMRPDGALRKAIAALGGVNGAYIIVSSKGSVSDTALTARRNAMAEALIDTPTAHNLELDFYDRRRIATWVNQHPGLIPWVRERIGKPLSGWRPYADWSSSPSDTKAEYVLDEDVRLIGTRLKDEGLDSVAGINRMRRILGKPKGVIRLVGLSGVGKTRLVQALFDDRIGEKALDRKLAVYADLGEQPDPVPQELLGRLNHLRQRCVLIVDNCGSTLHQKLVNGLKGSESLVSLITVEYDISDEEPEGTDVFKLEPASNGVIQKILERKYPSLSAPEVATITDFSEGNSRVALALAETAFKGESLANLKDGELFKRLFRQNNEDDPSLLAAAKACSLVFSFDGETLDGDEAEIPVLASLADQSVHVLHRYVAELHRRQLVQKRSKWRALLPHALAHRLAKEALQDVPTASIDAAIRSGPIERLSLSFSRRLGYLHDSPEAQKLVAGWLKEGGWISEVENLNAFGITLFENIAPVNPEATLGAIRAAYERSLAGEDVTSSLRKVVHVLRSLAYDPLLFDESAWLISRLTETAESSSHMGDAINVFGSLFNLYLSGTHAPVGQRAEIIRKLANTENVVDHKLAMHALEEMLKSTHFMSSYNFEFGARKRDYGFYPRSKSDFVTWYRTAFKLAEELEQRPALREEIRNYFAKEFAVLARGTGMIDELVAIADRFAVDGGWAQGWAGVRAAIARAKDAKQKQAQTKLRALAKRLEPHSIDELITTYVVPDEWSVLDLADLDTDDPKKYEKARQSVAKTCDDIGKVLALDSGELVRNLPALLASRSNRVALVGVAIGREAPDPRSAWNSIVPDVVSAEAEGKFSALLPGFIDGLARRSPELAEDLLDEALVNPDLHRSFVFLQAAVGLTVRGLDRAMKAASMQTVPIERFTAFSARASDGLTGTQLDVFLRAISERENGVDVALDIIGMRIHSARADKRSLDDEEKEAGREVLRRYEFSKEGHNDGYRVAEVAKACLVSPNDYTLVDKLCSRLLQSVTNHKAYAWHFAKLIAVLAAKFPLSVLNILVERNGAELGRHHSFFRHFIVKQPDPIEQIDEETLLDWAAEHPARRYLHLAEIVQPWRATDGSKVEHDEVRPLVWTPVAMRLIDEAPEPVRITEIFLDRFHPMGWGGSLAQILESRIPLLEMLTEHENATVAAWAKVALTAFKATVKRQQESEARSARARDERFDW